MDLKNQMQKPFFAKFMEGQISTPKPAKDEQQDQWITKPALDFDQTMKYPSDGDETFD